METTNETEAILYRRKWQAFLVDLAYDICGEGFYSVHPRKSDGETKNLHRRECFGVIHGFSMNGAVRRESVTRWRSAMNSEDLGKASDAISKRMTYLEECEERITPSAGVWWNFKEEKIQFFKEEDDGRTDKYWFFHLFVCSISTMCYHAGRDEYEWLKFCSFDKNAVERELPKLFGKYFNLWGSQEGSLCDTMEKEEVFINDRLHSPFVKHWDEKSAYIDGRYTMAPARILANWDSSSGKSFFAWPIDSFRQRCLDVFGAEGKILADGMMKKLFGEKKDQDDIANIEDLVSPKEPHVRKWTTFEGLFIYYCRGLSEYDYPRKFTTDILSMVVTKKHSDEQLDRLFLAFLVFQSEMMAAYLLENTYAVLCKNLPRESVDAIISVWKERLPNSLGCGEGVDHLLQHGELLPV